VSGFVAPPQIGEAALDGRPAAVDVVANVDQKHRDARLLGQHAEATQHDADPNGRVVGVVSIPANNTNNKKETKIYQAHTVCDADTKSNNNDANECFEKFSIRTNKPTLADETFSSRDSGVFVCIIIASIGILIIKLGNCLLKRIIKTGVSGL
jgi:hypothetical protein